MIPKHIERQGGSGSYRAQTQYVADARLGQEPGAKIGHFWYAGGQADDFWAGLAEAEATQAMNTRSRADKTYHLMVSFRPEDEAQLTVEVLRKIERRLAEALGFSEHQRHCGYHVNTAHHHLHIIYNTINPLTFNRHSPYCDYLKLTRACREIEQEFGLAGDKGMDENNPAEVRGNNKVQALEAQSGQESFFRYVQNQRAEIKAEMDKAVTWAEAQTIFLKRGLMIKAKGQGLVVQDREGWLAIKASAMDRDFSCARLEARFGYFEGPEKILETVKSDTAYAAAPLNQRPEAERLYARFQMEMKERRAALVAIDQEARRRYEERRAYWQQKRHELKRLPMLKADRAKVRLELEAQAGADRKRLRSETAAKKELARAVHPFTTWKTYLKHQPAASQGEAMAVLDSKEQIIQPETAVMYTR